jgi:hypothetical protein
VTLCGENSVSVTKLGVYWWAEVDAAGLSSEGIVPWPAITNPAMSACCTQVFTLGWLSDGIEDRFTTRRVVHQALISL